MSEDDALNEDAKVDVLIEYLEEPVSRSNPKYFWGGFYKMHVLEMCGRKDTPMLECYVISVAL